jgi:hypothetical protein
MIARLRSVWLVDLLADAASVFGVVLAVGPVFESADVRAGELVGEAVVEAEVWKVELPDGVALALAGCVWMMISMLEDKISLSTEIPMSSSDSSAFFDVIAAATSDGPIVVCARHRADRDSSETSVERIVSDADQSSGSIGATEWWSYGQAE